MGWKDLDLIRSHSSLLISLANMNGLHNLYRMAEYVENPDNIVKQLRLFYEPGTDPENPILNDDDVKNLLNMVIYGGTLQSWRDNLLTGKKYPHKRKNGKEALLFVVDSKYIPKIVKEQREHPFYTEFKADRDRLVKIILEKNPNIVERARIHKLKKDETSIEKINKCAISMFCQILENQIVFTAYKFLKKRNIMKTRVGGLEMDGLNIPPFDNENTDLTVLINDLNAHILKTDKFNVKFKFKGYLKDKDCRVHLDLIEKRKATPPVAYPLITTALQNDDDNLEEDNNDNIYINKIIDNDDEGAVLIYEKLKDKLIFCKGQVFMKSGNIWINNKIKVDCIILNYILKCDLKKMAKKSVRPYSKNVSGAKALREAVYCELYTKGENNGLYEKFFTTTKGRICFQDGVLDIRHKIEMKISKKKTIIKRGKFFKWDEVDFEYFSTIQINRNFAEYLEKPNHLIIDVIHKQIFKNLFGDECQTALQFLSRGLAGHLEDKAWARYMGNRNCGKGVFEKLSKSAIGDYHASINSANLLTKINKQSEVEKELSFAIELQFARFAVSQELPPPPKNNSVKVNGDLIKLLNGGGDPLRAKRNYDILITEFYNQSRLIVMCNDCPLLTNDDALDTCFDFHSTKQFKTQEDIDLMRKNGEEEQILSQYLPADENIKDKCMTDEWANAYIYLLLQNYKDTAVPFVKSYYKKEDEDVDESCKSNLRKFIFHTFNITNNENDFTPFEKIKEVFDLKAFGCISDKKIANELVAMGLKRNKNSGKRGYIGILIIDEILS